MTDTPSYAPQAMSTCAGVTPNFSASLMMNAFSVSFGLFFTELGYQMRVRSLCEGKKRHTVVAKRAVGGDVDVMLVVELDKLVLQEERVRLNLVHGLRELKLSVPANKDGPQQTPKSSALTGQTPVASAMPLMCSFVKFDTPIART